MNTCWVDWLDIALHVATTLGVLIVIVLLMLEKDIVVVDKREA